MHPVLTPLLLSLKVAVCAVAISLVLGVLCGFLLARCRFPGRELLDTLLTLPMVMPPTVLGFLFARPLWPPQRPRRLVEQHRH